MLVILGIILFILIFIFGGDKGAKSIITTGINAVILLFTIGLIYLGLHILVVTLLSCIIITLNIVFYQNEYNVKTKTALISALIVLAILIPLLYFLGGLSNVQGFSPTQVDIRESNGYSRDIDLNMTLLQLSVILMVLIGAIIDIAIAISSAIYEIYQSDVSISNEDLIRSGMNIGRDVLSTSIHTIFYIFIAEYMTLIILFVENYSFSEMINSKEFCQEFISIAVSGVGCCLVVPITTYLSVPLMKNTNKSHEVTN